MTTEKSGARSFVTATLPWLLGAGGLLVYFITLNHWISLQSLPTVARISGWLWRPELGRPLTLAVLFPFRCLPEAWIPLAMNLFTAVCAAIVLVLLARSVALLPHDLTPNDPLRKNRPVPILSTPTAWMPPVVAVIVCGLQLSFWEHATSATGEMINLLVFTYAIRCLLEFRIDQNQSWLSRSAFVYAAGMANDWVMVGYFPAFLAAIVWVKGFGPFWNLRFLLRMTLWGLAGLGLYLLLPTVQGLASDDWTFWAALKASLKSQKDALFRLQTPTFRILILTALLPLVVLSIPWKSHTVQCGDDTQLGIFFTRMTGHFVHGFCFVLSLWMALDPVFAPRNLPLGTPMLNYYYVAALVSGYCTGYFLLLRKGRLRKQPAKLPVVVTYVLICVLPLALLGKNFGLIRSTNGRDIREFARNLHEDLPEGRSVVLSENITQLLLLHAELGVHRHVKDALLLDTPSLVSPQYHEFMALRFKARWPMEPLTNRVEAAGPDKLLELISGFAMREPVVYLHPSSGLFFEAFVDQPNGSIHRLAPRSDKDDPRQTISDTVIATNEHIWQERWTNDLPSLVERMKNKPQYASQRSRKMFKWFQLPVEQDSTALMLGEAYSKTLNYWGVQMQQLGRWPEAQVWFERAIEVNPDNLAAHINVEYNKHCRQGDKTRLTIAWVQQQFPGLLARYDNWWAVLSENGPVDEPTFLLRTGRILLTSKNTRQAVRSFARCVELSPDWPAAKLWLAQGYNTLQKFTDALEVTDDIQSSNRLLNGHALAQLLRCRVTAMRGLGRTNDADACVESFISTNAEHSEVMSTAANLYALGGQFQKELNLLHKLIIHEPSNSELLRKKGFAELRLAKFAESITTLTTALSINPLDYDSRLLRAVARLRAGQMDAARADYLELLKRPESSQKALFGLGTIAWREGDTNAIIEYYQRYLSNAVPASSQYTIATERLSQLKDD